MEKIIQAVPQFLQGLGTEFELQEHVYKDDALSRGQLGLKYHMEKMEDLTREELERIQSFCFALSVSVLDSDGSILETTGVMAPEEKRAPVLDTLELNKPVLIYYFPSLEKEQEENEKIETAAEPDVNQEPKQKSCCSVFVSLSIPDDSNRCMLFEFSCEYLAQMYDEIMDWPGMLFTMMGEDNRVAFLLQDENDFLVYPQDAFTKKEQEILKVDLLRILWKNNGKWIEKQRYISASVLEKEYFLVHGVFPEMHLDIFIGSSRKDFFKASLAFVFILFGIIFVSLFLFRIYAINRMQNEVMEKERKAFRTQVRKATLPGFLLMLACMVGFTVLLLTLGNRVAIARNADNKWVAIQNEMEWFEKKKGVLTKFCSDIYKQRTQVVASFLKEFPSYKDQSGIKELCAINNTEYLMLFDSAGNETVASNSYTGFSVTGEGANLTEEYWAMVLGYPFVVVGPAADTYSGKQEMNVAIQLNQEDGGEGFVLASYNADELIKIIKNDEFSDLIVHYGINDVYMAAVVKTDDNSFISHTDKTLVGRPASEYLDQEVLNGNYEALTHYNRHSVYVSSYLGEDKNYVLVLSYRLTKDMINMVQILILLLVLLALFNYLSVHLVCETDKKHSNMLDMVSEKAIYIFPKGYSFFFTLVYIIDNIVIYTEEKSFFSRIYVKNGSTGYMCFRFGKPFFCCR